MVIKLTDDEYKNRYIQALTAPRRPGPTVSTRRRSHRVDSFGGHRQPKIKGYPLGSLWDVDGKDVDYINDQFGKSFKSNEGPLVRGVILVDAGYMPNKTISSQMTNIIKEMALTKSIGTIN